MTDEETKLNVKIRGGHRARTTKLGKDLENLLAEGNPGKARILKILEEVIRQRQFIVELDAKILPICTNVDVEIQESLEQSIETSKIVQIANEWLSYVNSPESTVKTSAPMKLPTIKMTKISRNPLEWQSFWDLFKTSFHDRKDLGEPAKFYYLTGQLEGNAALLLSDFEHTNESYAEAIDLLQNKYGKPKLIIQTRLHAIFDLKNPCLTYADLERFRSEYEAHIRGLKALSANISEAGYIFAAILFCKLPAEILNNIYRASPSNEV